MTVSLHRPPSGGPDDRSWTSTRAGRSLHTSDLVEALRSCVDEGERGRLLDDLVATNMPVAQSIAARYRSRGIPLEDLEQVAYLALTKAARRFDPHAGHAFLSFCVPTIRGEVRRYFRDQGWMVRPPRRIQELQQSVLRTQTELTASLGRTPAAREVSEALGVPIDDVLEATTGNGCFTPTSLDRIVGDGEASLGDLLASDQTTVHSAEARVVLAPVVRRLSDRDRSILRMRFFDGLTQREIADAIGVTQMQVSRLLTRIFRDLRRELGDLA